MALNEARVTWHEEADTSAVERDLTGLVSLIRRHPLGFAFHRVEAAKTYTWFGRHVLHVVP